MSITQTQKSNKRLIVWTGILGEFDVKIVRISQRNLELIPIFKFKCYLLLEMSNYLLSLHVNFAVRKSSLKNVSESSQPHCAEWVWVWRKFELVIDERLTVWCGRPFRVRLTQFCIAVEQKILNFDSNSAHGHWSKPFLKKNSEFQSALSWQWWHDHSVVWTESSLPWSFLIAHFACSK